MKKLIAISVIFALVAGAAFAADIGATVFGSVRVLEGANHDGSGMEIEEDNVFASGAMTRIRLEASGGDDTFGGWFRYEGGDWGSDVTPFGLAWWKPIDMFKLQIGGNPDGIWGKEGWTGWMFYQMPHDIGVADTGATWGWGDYFPPKHSTHGPGSWGESYMYRDAFYGGVGGAGAFVTISPIDIMDLNFFFPFMAPNLAEQVYNKFHFQLDLNLDFGNIALTYKSDSNNYEDGFFSGSNVYLYFGLTAVENLSLDFGVGFQFPVDDEDDNGYSPPIAIGLGLKYTVSDAFAIKFRFLVELGEVERIKGQDDEKGPTFLAFEINPSFAINDNITAHFGAGVHILSYDADNKPDPDTDSIVGFYINPYLQVGAEWGPTFYAGFRLWSNGYDLMKGTDKGAKDMNWAIPVGIMVSF